MAAAEKAGDDKEKMRFLYRAVSRQCAAGEVLSAFKPSVATASDEAASVQRAVCSLGDADELRHLHADAGFQNIDIQVVNLTIRHDDAATFIPGLMASLPFAEAIAALDEFNQNALFNGVIEDLSPYIDGQNLAIAHVVSAHT